MYRIVGVGHTVAHTLAMVLNIAGYNIDLINSQWEVWNEQKAVEARRELTSIWLSYAFEFLSFQYRASSNFELVKLSPLMKDNRHDFDMAPETLGSSQT